MKLNASTVPATVTKEFKYRCHWVFGKVYLNVEIEVRRPTNGKFSHPQVIGLIIWTQFVCGDF